MLYAHPFIACKTELDRPKMLTKSNGVFCPAATAVNVVNR